MLDFHCKKMSCSPRKSIFLLLIAIVVVAGAVLFVRSFYLSPVPLEKWDLAKLRKVLKIDMETYSGDSSGPVKKYFFKIKPGPLQACEPYLIAVAHYPTMAPGKVVVIIGALSSSEFSKLNVTLKLPGASAPVPVKFVPSKDADNQYAIPARHGLVFLDAQVALDVEAFRGWLDTPDYLQLQAGGDTITPRFARAKFVEKCTKFLKDLETPSTGSIAFTLNDKDLP